ncbi:hypothetical protein [Cereibacter sphaeroides]|uniref:hypothetical protein n=1 Tax=Cereibacter sphaeroides TaxID=1063 RepID=UPI0011C43C4E|nr:hypothetical protein [Cereibacter sphaeroides]
MSEDWREIPMTAIDWDALRPVLGRSANDLRRLSRGYRPDDPPREWCAGAWKQMTLGQVADMGRRQLLRHNNLGEKGLALLQMVIDLAAAGRCPTTDGAAVDALRPSRDGND